MSRLSISFQILAVLLSGLSLVLDEELFSPEYALYLSTALLLFAAIKAPGGKLSQSRYFLSVAAFGTGILATVLLIATPGGETELRAAFWFEFAIDSAKILGASAFLCGHICALISQAYLLRSGKEASQKLASALSKESFAWCISMILMCLLVYTARQIHFEIDQAYFKTQAASAATRELLCESADKVEIFAFFREQGEVRPEISRYLEGLKQECPELIEIAFLERYSSPQLSDELRVFEEGSLVFRRGGQIERLVIGDNLKQASDKLAQLDNLVYEESRQLMRGRRKIYLLSGHGELSESLGDKEHRGSKMFRELLRRSNMEAVDLGLSQGSNRKIPEDADLLVIAAPTRELAPGELAAISEYLNHGGKLWLALEPRTFASSDSFSSWRQLLESLRLKLDSGLLKNSRQFAKRFDDERDYRSLVISAFSSHPAVTTLYRSRGKSAVVFPNAGQWDPSADAVEQEGASSEWLLQAPIDSESETAEKAEDIVDAESAARAAANAKAPPLVLARELKTPDGKSSKQLFFSGSEFMDDPWLSQVQTNQIFVIDLLRWLDGEASLAAMAESEADVKIQRTQKTDGFWFLTFAGLLPLLIGAAALFYRNKKFKALAGSAPKPKAPAETDEKESRQAGSHD